jgi:glutathione S-transferase
LFREAQGRWRALTLQALGDGLADAVVRRNQEMRLPEERRSAEVIQRQTAAIETSFAVADRASAKFPAHPTIGEIAIGCAIGYLDLRVPHDGWRDRYPKLARWLETFSRYPSVQATKPPPA